MAPSLLEIPLVFGFLLGVSLAAPPGPILALAADRGVRFGFWPCLVVGLGASLGDAVLCALMALGVVHLLAAQTTLLAVLSIAGGLLMGYFAWGAFRSGEAARREGGLGARPTERGERLARSGGFVAGLVLAMTSPFNYAWWTGAGTSLFADFGVTVFIGFFAGLLSWILFFATAIAWARTRVKGILVIVSYASAVMLVAFGAWLVWRGASELAAL